jgi:hypothetical protein
MTRLTACFLSIGACLAAGLLGSSTARGAEASKEGVEFFEKNIRPVLSESCFKCHSADAKANKKLKGKFFADSLEGLTKGGESGNPGVVAGDPEKSALIKGIRYEYKGDDESLNMPPKNKKDGTGGKLQDNVIKNFEQWIKMGAPVPKDFEKPKEAKADAGPGSIAPPAGAAWQALDAKKHWAFIAPQMPAIPAVKTTGWARNDVDRFVLAKLESKGLQPAGLRPAAQLDRRALIRRATFDLIGLPPTPAEIDSFVGDKSPDAAAFETVVDRLLADPRYGERWARHWLDVARYSDTKGYVFQEERRYPYAYTYRDYVIRAFNEDKPYDRFLIEQIAADQLDLTNDKSPLAAMGFLTLGRRFLNNVHDIIDDRLDVVSRGTMALTVGCARCHDHKFDPIPTKDYYSLHGIFASSMEPKELPLISSGEGSPAFQAELKNRQAAAEQYLSTRSVEILGQVRSAKGLADYLMGVANKAPGSDGQAAAGDLSRYMLGRFQTFLALSAQHQDPVFAAWRAYAALPAADFANKSAEVTERLAKVDAKKPVHPLVLKAFADKPPKSLRDVAERYADLLVKYDKAEKLADPYEEALRQVLRGPDSPLSVPREELGRLFKRDSQDKLRQLQNKVTEWQASSPEAPARAMVLNDAPNPHDSQVLMRGNPGNPGVVAPRQFLECISGPNRPAFKQGSGRLQFAQAIASKENPLTARVLVNRVWGWHFGRPIVATPSDFGTRSDPPSHPELLDYLAVSFMNDGWSIKKLQKRILMSGTYQQASEVENAQARAADPENRLLWRQNRLRLDFEEVRDTLLYVSGQLNPTLYGRPVDIASANETRRTIYGFVDRQNLPSMYRSFDFASPDMHSPQRLSTTVPQQALFFLNSPFSQQQAKKLLDRPEIKSQASVPAKVTQLYRLLYGREPQADEIELGKKFIEAETSVSSETVVAAPKPTWLYGYGVVDEKTKKVASFAVLPYKGRTGWRGSQKLPDPILGFVSLTANGGHPGNAAHAAIRRWTAPAAGTVDITGTLDHADANGDGVRGRIVSSRIGILGEWSVKHSKATTNAKAIAVQAGDTIDFVVESGATDTSDTFTWAPILNLSGPGASKQFDAAKDYATASNDSPAPMEKLSPWEKYVQVLMSSNEFVFVD